SRDVEVSAKRGVSRSRRAVLKTGVVLIPVVFVCSLAVPLELHASGQQQEGAQAVASEALASIAAAVSRAESGDSSAGEELMQTLMKGDSVRPGYGLAVAWLRSTAAKGNPHAQFLLGYLYEHGQGVPRSYTMAAENYEAAAAQGHSIAQNNLASLYRHG